MCTKIQPDVTIFKNIIIRDFLHRELCATKLIKKYVSEY